MKLKILLLLALWNFAAFAQLNVSVGKPHVTGSKCVVRLEMKNGFGEPIQSAKAGVFLLDGEGKMVGQGSRWVIGGAGDKSSLAPGATNVFHFIVATERPLTSTNLSARVNFSRVVSKSGKLEDASKDVIIRSVSH
jgi:hypothetical protein